MNMNSNVDITKAITNEAAIMKNLIVCIKFVFFLLLDKLITNSYNRTMSLLRNYFF